MIAMTIGTSSSFLDSALSKSGAVNWSEETKVQF